MLVESNDQALEMVASSKAVFLVVLVRPSSLPGVIRR